jgi:hypothetical protein
MLAPDRLRQSRELPAAIVKPCSCSWQKPACITPGTGRRLCGQNTDEHDEYLLLEAMSRRFLAERRAHGELLELDVASMAASQASITSSESFDGEAESSAKDEASQSNVALLAACQKLEVHFILEPSQEVVIGYIAVEKARDPSPQSAVKELVLRQVYVEPECRKAGYATAALKMIFSNTSVVAVASPTAAACQLLGKVGFTKRLDTEDDSNLISFHRAQPLFNQWEDDWSHARTR